MKNIKPLKKFGQNYLTDQNILEKIVKEINPLPDDSIVEIGPGTGALTSKLHALVPGFTAVEIDTRVIENLSANFPDLKIMKNDFLKVDLNTIYGGQNKLRIVGNIPYNLTSPILFKIIENYKIIKDAVLMVQLEVAQRMNAERGTKDYGILAVVLKYFADVKLAFKVSPNVFYPKPKVYSAVVHIFIKDIPGEVEPYFIPVVKAAFGNRRKTLKNSLSNSIFGNLNFSEAGIDLTRRAEQLELDDFIRLAEFVRTKLNPF